MPKGRHLKPEFFTDKHIVSVSPLARLLYQGLWCYSHDCGHLDDEPLELKMRILPGDNCDVNDLLDELADTGRVERKDGILYLPKLRDHARVDKRYETVCDACKEGRDHAVTTTGKAPPKALVTTGPRSDHGVTTAGAQRDHDADGDVSDGDGEVMVKAAPRARATSLPKGFAPNETHRRIASERGLDLDAVVVQFEDFHRAKGSTFKDWDAALRTWLRNERPQVRGLRAVPQQPMFTPDGLPIIDKSDDRR